MIQVMAKTKWRMAWFWYRHAPHQEEAIDLLFDHIAELPGGALLLTEHSEWFQKYRQTPKLVHSATHPEGQ
jgi:hypothetical protein